MDFTTQIFIDFETEINSVISKVELFDLIKKRYNETRLLLVNNGIKFQDDIFYEDIPLNPSLSDINNELYNYFLIIADLHRTFINNRIIDRLEYNQKHRDHFRKLTKDKINSFL